MLRYTYLHDRVEMRRYEHRPQHRRPHEDDATAHDDEEQDGRETEGADTLAVRVAQLTQTQIEDIHRRQRPPTVRPTRRTEYDHRHAHEHDKGDDERHEGAHQLLDGPSQG